MIIYPNQANRSQCCKDGEDVKDESKLFVGQERVKYEEDERRFEQIEAGLEHGGKSHERQRERDQECLGEGVGGVPVPRHDAPQVALVLDGVEEEDVPLGPHVGDVPEVGVDAGGAEDGEDGECGAEEEGGLDLEALLQELVEDERPQEQHELAAEDDAGEDEVEDGADEVVADPGGEGEEDEDEGEGVGEGAGGVEEEVELDAGQQRESRAHLRAEDGAQGAAEAAPGEDGEGAEEEARE